MVRAKAVREVHPPFFLFGIGIIKKTLTKRPLVPNQALVGAGTSQTGVSDTKKRFGLGRGSLNDSPHTHTTVRGKKAPSGPPIKSQSTLMIGWRLQRNENKPEQTNRLFNLKGGVSHTILISSSPDDVQEKLHIPSGTRAEKKGSDRDSS